MLSESVHADGPNGIKVHCFGTPFRNVINPGEHGAASQGANAQARPLSARQQEHKHLVAVGHGSDRFVSKGLVVSSTPSDGGVSLENQLMTSQLSQWKWLKWFRL